MATVYLVSFYQVNVEFEERTQPVVDPEIGNDVEEEDVPCADDSTSVPHDRAHDQKTDISHENQFPLGTGEQCTGGVEVAGLLDSTLAVGATLDTGSHIQEEIQLPSEQLVADKLDEGHDGGFLGQVLELLNGDIALGCELILGPGNKDSILFHVAGVAVVTGVGDLP